MKKEKTDMIICGLLTDTDCRNCYLKNKCPIRFSDEEWENEIEYDIMMMSDDWMDW